MKRTISLLLIFVFALSLSGCGAAAKPEDTVNGFLSATKELDLEKMATYVNSDSAGDLSKLDSEDDMEQYFLGYIKDCASKMTYEIQSTKVTDHTAVVTVHLKYIDSAPLLKAVIGELFTKALATAFSGSELTDEQEKAMFTEAIQSQTSTVGDHYTESVVDIPCTKTDDKWLIDSVNDDLANVIMANFMSAANDISSSFGGSDSSKADSSATQKPQIGTGVVGDYSVSITGYQLTQDDENNPAVIVTYDWTNHSSGTTNFDASISTQVFQNGIECDTAYLSDGNSYDSGTSMKDVKPGTALTVQAAYVLQDTENPIEVDATEFMSFENNPPTVTQTFHLQ